MGAQRLGGALHQVLRAPAVGPAAKLRQVVELADHDREGAFRLAGARELLAHAPGQVVGVRQAGLAVEALLALRRGVGEGVLEAAPDGSMRPSLSRGLGGHRR
jgi:hypothetical protein